jgi:hypothetical protein
MAHVTTSDEARAVIRPITDRLANAGLVELASWLTDCARSTPYLVDDGVQELDAEVTLIVRAIAQHKGDNR